MVSTRGLRYKFQVGEKVLCYEPDPTKAKVLYDAKVMAIVESKDKRSKRIEYLIHFQGWNSSWDRRVNEDFVLKDTEENRQLQKDLAEKSQLQIGAYLYRREQKKRMRHMSGSSTETKLRFRGSSDEGSSCSTAGGREFNDDTLMAEVHSPSTAATHQTTSINNMGNNDTDIEHPTSSHQSSHLAAATDVESSSSESVQCEDRVSLQIGEKLKSYIEYDYNMITKHEKLVSLPAKIPVIAILENFVKHYSIKDLCPPVELPRRRNSSAKVEKREKNYEKLQNSINLRKEVADGLRIYFEFTLKDYLLYKQEKEQAKHVLSEENLKNFTYIPSARQYDMLSFIQETPNTPLGGEMSESQVSCSEQQQTQEDNAKRRLRSYKTEENEFIFDLGKPESSCISGTSSGSSTPNPNNINNLLKYNYGITSKGKEMLQNILAWQILPSDAPPQASMIYGAIHLSRLIVKLPDFLNATTISDEKLKILLQYLDSFIEYLESKKEWFGEPQYKSATSCLAINSSSSSSCSSATTVVSKTSPFADLKDEINPLVTSDAIKLETVIKTD